MDDPTSVTPNAEEATKQEQGRAQVGSLVATANSVKTCGQMKYATIDQLEQIMIAVAPLVVEARPECQCKPTKRVGQNCEQAGVA